MGPPEVEVLEIFYRPTKKATGNPYPTRGQIKDMIFKDISQSIEAVLHSIELSLMEDGNTPSWGHSKKKAKGNPYPRRGRIKEQIFKDIFRSVPSRPAAQVQGRPDTDSKSREIHLHCMPQVLNNQYDH